MSSSVPSVRMRFSSMSPSRMRMTVGRLTSKELAISVREVGEWVRIYSKMAARLIRRIWAPSMVVNIIIYFL